MCASACPHVWFADQVGGSVPQSHVRKSLGPEGKAESLSQGEARQTSPDSLVDLLVFVISNPK